MSEHFVMCVRAIKDGKFIAEPGPTRFLLVPDNEPPSPQHIVKKADVWFKKLRAASVWGNDPRRGGDRGDILIFVHGYNNDQQVVMQRHRRLATDLADVNYKGVVMSFDWPSDNEAL